MPAIRTLGLAAAFGLAALPALALALNPPSRVDDVGLNARTLTVRFTDGAVCRADVVAPGASGMFLDCPHPVRFDVRIERPNWLQPVLGNLVSPYGTVTIISEDGWRQDFKMPASRRGDQGRKNN